MPRDNPEPYTPEMFDAVIGSLEEECARLRAVKEFMLVSGVTKLEVRNSLTLRKKGLPAISSFANAAIDAMRDRRLKG